MFNAALQNLEYEGSSDEEAEGETLTDKQSQVNIQELPSAEDEEEFVN